MAARSDNPQAPHGHREFTELFEEVSFTRKVKKVLHGLGQPYSSGANKYARFQVLRLTAPLAAVVVPAAVVVALMLVESIETPPQLAVPVRIVEVEEVPDLDEIEEELIEEEFEPPEPIEMDFSPELALQTESPVPMDEPVLSPQPADITSVVIVRSPVILKGIIGNRAPGTRGGAMAEYGGNEETEGAVIKALRWLKLKQEEDGSWPQHRVAMTGLALLTFLAHGETPASEEFGETVEKAIRYLIAAQKADGSFPGNYDIPIGAYAICEGYALTKVPMLKTAAERAVAFIIEGQHESGGWDYNCRQSERDDTSYMGWCAQALKAAHMAGIEHPAMESAIIKAIAGFQQNAHPEGGFGYTGPGKGGLTGVGVLCMQLLGAAREKEVRLGLAYLDQVSFDWKTPWGARPIYYWYYTTQAKFHAGPKTWRDWNRKFSRELVENQVVLKGAGQDGQDVGYWDSPSETETTYGPVYATTLCALQLQVYYRYLPTFKPPEPIEYEEPATPEGEIEIEITI